MLNVAKCQGQLVPFLSYLGKTTKEGTGVGGVGGELPPSQIRVKTVGYFRKRAPSCIFERMFDRILNVILPNNLS